ncbi:MAG: radical SAM protein, partial [Gemmataceae bacterium]|nr:radical SAM protein [Gemmataceae bacterium]
MHTPAAAPPRFHLSPEQRIVYRRYAGLALPRHTSYPIAPVWREDYRPVDFRADLAEIEAPLSLYVHLPFCERLCYYCACTKEIVPPAKRREHDPAEDVLAGLHLEVNRLADAVPHRTVRQVHLGGGSPTFFHAHQLKRLWHLLAGRFDIAADAELAVEIDPRITTREQLSVLREIGFQRASLGVQDFAPRVQLAVNRQHSFDLVAQTVAWCR